MEHDPLFGSWLQRRRKALGLTQRELGDCAGCSAATVRKIEAEERRPSEAVAEKMAACLGLQENEVDDFLRFARGGWADEAPAAPPRLPALPTQLEGDPEGRRPEHPPPSFLTDPDPEPLPEGPFVGRVEALTWLEGHLQTALAGRGGGVFVSAESGNGKTSLLDAFARRAQAAHPDLVVARGLCSAFAGSGDPYLPFRDVMTMLCGDVEARWTAGALTGDHARRLWGTAPVTLDALHNRGRDLIGVVVPAVAIERALIAADGPAVQRQRIVQERGDLPQPQLFEQLTEVLRTVADRRPLLVLLDDLQWADRGSIGMLFHLLRRLEGAPVLVVGAYRSDEVPLAAPEGDEPHPLAAVVQESRRRRGEVVLSLDRHGPIGGRAFVDALIDSEPNDLDAPFRDELTRRTDGHPLFTVELLRDLQTRGDLVRDRRGRWREGETLDWSTLPARVEAVIEQRLARLEPDLRELLTVASVEGEGFTAEVLARVQGASALATLRALDGDLAARHALVREEGEVRSGARPLARYRFAHALFQQYLYRTLGSGRRRLLHAEVAGALEAVTDPNDDEVALTIATHLAEAGLPERAAPYLERAGDRSRRLFALDEAAERYREAADAYPAEEPTLRARSLRKVGECLWVMGMGNVDAAFAAFQSALDLYRQEGDRLEVATMHRLIARLHWENADRTASMRHYREALALAEQEGESPELAMIISSLSQMHMLGDDNEEAVREGERALALAERLGLPEVRLHALNNIGLATAHLGDFAASEAMLRESVAMARELGLTHDTCRGMHNLSEALLLRCDPESAYAVAEELLHYAARTRTGLFHPGAHILMAQIDWRRGRPARARERLAALIADDSAHLLGHLGFLRRVVVARIANDLEQPEEALTALDGTAALLSDNDELQIHCPYSAERIRAQEALGNEDEAGATLDTLIELIARQRSETACNPFHADLATALVWSERHQPERRLRRRGTLLALLERSATTLDTPEGHALLHEGRAAIAVNEDDLEGARRHLEAALTLWEGLGWPFDALRASTRLADVVDLLGDTEGAARRRGADRERRAALIAAAGPDPTAGADGR